jgi:Bacterial hydrolase
MVRTTLPDLDVKTSETGCCPKFDPAGWDGETFRFDNWSFVRATTASFLHIPLNIGSVFKSTFDRIQQAEAAPESTYLILTNDLSAWRGEHLFLVTKEVPATEMVNLSGTFLAKVFEGPYREARKWCEEMEGYVKDQGRKLKTSYFFYTTCPKCVKHYGKNYVVGLAHVED